MNTILEVSCLKKSYDGRNPVLKGIDIRVKKGEIFALLGVNGAGKTTALECMEGLRNFDSGKIIINGKMGIQLQSSSLPSHIKPMEAVKLFAKWNKVSVNESLLKQLGITDFNKKVYSDLSTGQKRRLHLALAMLNDPDLIFLDEPTAGLDVEGRIALHGLIRELKAQGKTIILASHDMAEVETLCDEIAILNSGNIVFSGTVSELTEQVGRHYNIEIQSNRGTECFESEQIADTLLILLEQYKKNGILVEDIKINRGTFEQHFIEMAGRKEGN